MRRFITSIAAAISLCTLLAAAAAAGPAPFRISNDPGMIVLEYTRVQRDLPQPDPLPLIRIYGDGLVWVHYPVGTQRAGDYEFRLEAGELHRLIRQIRDDGLLEFDRVRTLKRRAAMQEQDNGHRPVSDATDTVVRVRLERYRGRTDFDKYIVWTGVYTDANDFPRLRPVQSLARFERLLQTMLENRPLSPVELPLAQR